MGKEILVHMTSGLTYLKDLVDLFLSIENLETHTVHVLEFYDHLFESLTYSDYGQFSRIYVGEKCKMS